MSCLETGKAPTPVCEQLTRQHPTHPQRCYQNIALCILPHGKPKVQEELPRRAKEPHASLHHMRALIHMRLLQAPGARTKIRFGLFQSI